MRNAGVPSREGRRLVRPPGRPLHPREAGAGRADTRRAGRPADAGPAAEPGPDRTAADRRRRSSDFVREPSPPGRLRASWSTGCSPRRTSASAGPGTGWTSSASPRRTATSGTTRSITPGATATTSSAPSTTTCPTTSSSASTSPATCCRRAGTSEEQFNESVIGTGFYRFGEVNHDDCIGLPPDRLRPARQPDRHADQGVPGDDRGLRPLPRPQARRRLDEGLLRPARRPPQLAAGQPHDRRAGGQRRRRSNGCATEGRDPQGAGRRLAAGRRGRPLPAGGPGKSASRPDAPNWPRARPGALEKWVAALAVEKPPLEDPLEPWRTLVRRRPMAMPSDSGGSWSSKYAQGGPRAARSSTRRSS